MPTAAAANSFCGRLSPKRRIRQDLALLALGETITHLIITQAGDGGSLLLQDRAILRMKTALHVLAENQLKGDILIYLLYTLSATGKYEFILAYC